MTRSEKVMIHRVVLAPEVRDDPQNHENLVHLTMSWMLRDLFHSTLLKMGYYVGEGIAGQIDDVEYGTTFPVYKISNGQRTNVKIADMMTYKD